MRGRYELVLLSITLRTVYRSILLVGGYEGLKKLGNNPKDEDEGLLRGLKIIRKSKEYLKMLIDILVISYNYYELELNFSVLFGSSQLPAPRSFLVVPKSQSSFVHISYFM